MSAPAVLHGFFRSSTSFRVRAALALKGVEVAQRSYVLRKAEQRAGPHLALNPQGLVPTLELDDGSALTQSLAIIEWLDEAYPDPPLLPLDPLGRARVRSLAHMIALDVHPLNNLRVLGRLSETFGADEAAVADWFRHWARLGFEAMEARLAREPETGRYCHGDCITQADLCLVAQSVNNRRFDVDEAPFPTLRRIVAAALDVPEIASALPERQPDAA